MRRRVRLQADGEVSSRMGLPVVLSGHSTRTGSVMANGAANCPECGSLMRIKETNYAKGFTYRIAECDCGERWELEERKVSRLPSRTRPPAPVYSGIAPSTAAYGC